MFPSSLLLAYSMVVELRCMRSRNRPILRAVFHPTLRQPGACISDKAHVSMRGVARVEAFQYAIIPPTISLTRFNEELRV